MSARAKKYMAVESLGSGIVNGILNWVAAYALFHGRTLIPTEGRNGLVLDLVGETFLVVFLSMWAAFHISRHRRRAGKLPVYESASRPPQRRLWLRPLITGTIFTCVLVPCNALLLPRLFPEGLSFGQVIWFKTLYGTLLGAIATYLAVRIFLREIE